MILGEAKTPVRPAVTWVDGAAQVHDDYEVNVPGFFVPNVFSFATEGKEYRFGSVRMPLRCGRRGERTRVALPGLGEVELAVTSMLRPDMVLNIAQSFTTSRRIVNGARSSSSPIPAVRGLQSNRRESRGGASTQGADLALSGIRQVSAHGVRISEAPLHPELGNPTVIIVVDRIDLDTQITATFYAADVPNTVAAQTRSELQQLLDRDTRKVIITTIHKFGEAGGILTIGRTSLSWSTKPTVPRKGTSVGRCGMHCRMLSCLVLPAPRSITPDRNTFYAFGAQTIRAGI